jgi:hypothetical protein
VHNVEVEVYIGALLVLVRGQLGLLMALEPGVVLLVVPPRLLLQLLGSQILLVCALHRGRKTALTMPPEGADDYGLIRQAD